jgi:hypothetical protein
MLKKEKKTIVLLQQLTNGMPWACWPGMVGTGFPVASIFW